MNTAWVSDVAQSTDMALSTGSDTLVDELGVSIVIGRLDYDPKQLTDWDLDTKQKTDWYPQSGSASIYDTDNATLTTEALAELTTEGLAILQVDDIYSIEKQRTVWDD